MANQYICDACGRDCVTSLGLQRHKQGKKCKGNNQQNNNKNNEESTNNDCLHSWRNLNGHVHQESLAIQEGYREVCRKCQVVQ
jgi:hypothetical protein